MRAGQPLRLRLLAPPYIARRPCVDPYAVSKDVCEPPGSKQASSSAKTHLKDRQVGGHLHNALCRLPAKAVLER